MIENAHFQKYHRILKILPTLLNFKRIKNTTNDSFFTKITISILFQKYPKIFKKFNNALKLSIKVNKKTKKKTLQQ